MKYKLKLAVSLGVALLLTQSVMAQQDQHAGHAMSSQAGGTASNAMMKSMQSGMNQMMSMKMTGDPDHDFATLLKMHHQSAVEMADLEIKQGKNAQVKALATKIKAANQKEITELNQFITSHKPQSSSSKLGQDAMKIMHSGSHSMNGNVDHDFASMMAQHHQQGVDMAKAFLKEAGPSGGKTEKMKTMAQKVIREQTKEISELKKLENQVASR
ncbi:hypothetical protein BN8_p06840 (plasmid) [Fibrisoma limi BUZ 3]|uniref:DUF305 domain-containing protein n=1 Tax=Fibrisoma limi BUZ 3 TaxID=1185876 RepID=I2GU39_9BACT|nr:DUF305 domain-containing protein [Fibrisoma limi]CCH57640.1 hypothetical protein BN8_p06840 [Fibrisoma limi BUZ 3]